MTSFAGSGTIAGEVKEPQFLILRRGEKHLSIRSSSLEVNVLKRFEGEFDPAELDWCQDGYPRTRISIAFLEVILIIIK